MRARKGWAAVFAALVMTAVQAANLSVTDVKIAQRYPWNGLVDITYTVNCDDPNKDVWVYPVGYDADKDVSVALMPQYLSGAGASNAVHNGTHQMTWDMAKQMGKDYNRAAFSVKLHAYCDAAPYMVIDLSAGSEAEKYPVSYLSEIPEGGWTDEPYKTTKMVFRLILPGTFMMGSPEDEEGRGSLWNYNVCYGGPETLHRVSLTKPFYCAIFELSCAQIARVLGGAESGQYAKTLAYNDIRGNLLGAQWPLHQQVDADSLTGKLRLRTGITIDLPTEAQWEYACRAGSQAAYNNNSNIQPAANIPNAWGLYGMHESPAEWCVDWFKWDIVKDVVDPIGGESGSLRVVRGGGAWYHDEKYQERRSAARFFISEGGKDRMINAPWATDVACARLVALPVCK